MKRINKNSSGITIVSLVVIIILLLILAGISLQALTNTGLIENANRAKTETKRAQVEEWLNLKLMEEQAGKPMGSAEEITNLTRQNVLRNRAELESVGKNISIEEVVSENIGNMVDTYFYVQVDKEMYKVDAKNAKFLGEEGKIPPSIYIESITQASNSITVTVLTKRNEDGKIEYYIKADGEENYTLKETTEATSYTFSGLEQNKKYSIKAVAIASNNKTAQVSKEIILGSVPDLQEGDVTFTYKVDGQDISKETWTNKNVTVTVSTTIAGYTLQTSKDNITWHDVKNQIFTENGKIYVRLWNGTNAGASISGNVTNIDTLPPKEFTPTATSTTKSITVTANTEDADSTTTSGKSGMSGYRFKIDEGNWTEYQTSGTYTWNDLTQTTSHTITVEAKDNVGNTTTATVTKDTGKVTDLTQANVTFTYDPSTWTTGSVKVTAELKDMTSEYTLKITDSDPSGASKQTALSWANGSAGITASSNKAVYAVLVDSEGQIGTAANGNVSNIDTTAPQISTALSSTTQGIDSITLSVGVTDANSGLGKIEWYYGTTNNPTTLAGTTPVTEMNGSITGPTTAQTKTYAVSGLTANTTYYFKAVAYDVAGNQISSSVISAATLNPTSEYISYTPSDTSWNVTTIQEALDSLYSR